MCLFTKEKLLTELDTVICGVLWQLLVLVLILLTRVLFCDIEIILKVNGDLCAPFKERCLACLALAIEH